MRAERPLVCAQRRRLHRNFLIEKVVDEVTCEARLNVFSPLGDSAVEACRVLKSDSIVIYCDVISTSFFWHPDNFILEDQDEVLKGVGFRISRGTLSS
jgi:hypothetical protein